MKNKINKFYNDNFDDKKAALIIPQTRVFFTVPLNGKYSGSFILKSADTRPVRGMIYSSTFRMQSKETGFEGTMEKIPFVFDAVGLPAGAMVKGKFDIVSEAGEYEIFFTASVEVPSIETSMGRITNVEEFSRLAAYDYREAVSLFESAKFRELLARENSDVANLYEGVRKLSVGDRAVEEFLVGTGYKDAIRLVFQSPERFYDKIERSQSDMIEVGKNTWGYMPIEIVTEGEFLRIDRKRITTHEFSGNRYELEYIIRHEKLHEGVNTGYIKLITPYELYEFKVIVSNIKYNELVHEQTRARREQARELLEDYVSYRMGGLTLNEWIEKDRPNLSDNIDSEVLQMIMNFLNIYMLLEEGDRSSANELLDIYSQKRWSKAREAGYWACYAYLVSRANNDLSYTMRVTEEIRKLYERTEDNWLLLWVLLQMEEYLIQNTERRLQILEEQWNSKNFHTLLYLEAFLTIRDQPGLIDLNNKFILRTLLFARRRGVLTGDIASTVALSVSRYRDFDNKVYEILEGCYEVCPTKDTLSSICRYLIMCHRTDSRYFPWYEQGVRQELHIARLYEFFMYSINEESIEKLPQAIYLYFSHQNELNAAKKAFMYANLVRYIEDYPDIYENSRDQMEHFARSSLRAGKITPNLRTLYRHFLSSWTLDRETSLALTDILYSYEIKIKNPSIKQVVVLYDNMNRSMTVPVVGGSAQIQIYSGKDHIILKNDKGDIFISTIPYELIRLFPEERYLDSLKIQGLDHIGLLLDTCESGRITEGNVRSFEILAKNDGLRENRRKEIRRDLLFYYFEHEDTKRVLQSIGDMDEEWMDGSARSRLVDIYLQQNQIKKATELIRHYGYRGMDAQVVREWCTVFITEDMPRENTVLMDACLFCFEKNVYDDVILGYLIDYFCGKTSDMIRLWFVAAASDHSLHNLEERILIQMLFSEEVASEEDIFYDYYIHGANDRVKQAYLSYKSYGYFVHNKILDERFFEYIETDYARNMSINESCKLAAVKHFSGIHLEDKVIRRMIDDFMTDLRSGEYFFSFFQNYEEDIIRKFSFSNRIIIQYKGSTRSKVTLHYSIHRENQKASVFTEVVMPQTYHTYFMKELLVFSGEVVDYYIEEENESGINVVQVGRARQEDELSDFTGRFGAINRIIRSNNPDNLLEEYDRTGYLVTQMFRVV